jgi:hemerythrin
MAYWRWDPAYSVGIAVIDEQHKRIIEYINELNKATLYQDNQKVASVLLHLVDYTISHFSFEESLMEEANYTMLEAHKRDTTMAKTSQSSL